MQVVINGIPLDVGGELPEAERARAGLRLRSPWARLLRPGGSRNARLEAANCTVDTFNGSFRLYPCLDGYLTPDRTWRTAVSVELDQGRVRRVLVRVIEGRYAASGFVQRFREAAASLLGEGQDIDRHTRRWRQGATSCLCSLEQGGRNATFLIEAAD